MLYDLHNVHMKLICAQMAGTYKVALESSIGVQQKIPEFYLSIPGSLGNYVQYIYQSPLFTRLRFGKWEDILKEEVVDSLAYTPVLQHCARGIAFATTNKLLLAVAELEMMKKKITDPSLKDPLTHVHAD